MEKTSIYAPSLKHISHQAIPTDCPHCMHYRTQLSRLQRQVTQKSVQIQSMKSVVLPPRQPNQEEMNMYEEQLRNLKEKFISLRKKLNQLDQDNDNLQTQVIQLQSENQMLRNEKQAGKQEMRKSKKTEECQTEPDSSIRDTISTFYQGESDEPQSRNNAKLRQEARDDCREFEGELRKLEHLLNWRESIQERRHREIERLGSILQDTTI